ncbi:putative B3 domain-containing protein [Dichanthelium oligosanthes]|uniref:Putative B3 domain-containing protein n=1 Tax=Dichanthelium oligosanthes TaxID=888268 RepID=A0A1E5V9D7_9POAL|nr:putative B3 domain-containing protein [Dichanthelium oligosanthes]
MGSSSGNHGARASIARHLKVLLPSSTSRKLGIPPKFVQKNIAESEMKSSVAVLLSPLYNFCRIVVEKDESGNMFFSGGWSQFLVSHGITEFDVLLLRYEGNMVFTMKVFGPDGCQKGFKDQDTSSKELDRTSFGDIKTLEDEEDPASSSSKRKSMAKKPDVSAHVHHFLLKTVAGTFCKAIGLQKRASEITLRTTSAHGTRTWQVRFLVYKYRSRTGQLTRGWRGFCVDNAIKEGDVCTFNIVETTLWHVEIMRRS